VTNRTNSAEIMKSAQPQKAWERLDQAVTRMEAAVKARPSLSNDRVDSEESDELRKENSTLKEVNDIVSARLDGAINRLRTILES